MRALPLGLVLLLSTPLLAGCLGAEDAPLAPAETVLRDGLLVETVEGTGQCEGCFWAEGVYGRDNPYPAILPIKRPGPINATVVATWQNAVDELLFSVRYADQRATYAGKSPYTFSIPVEHLLRPTQLVIDAMPAKNGYARDLVIDYVLTLQYSAEDVRTRPLPPPMNLTLESESFVGLAATVPSPFGPSWGFPGPDAKEAQFEVPRAFPAKATLTATWTSTTDSSRTLEVWFTADDRTFQLMGKGQSPLVLDVPVDFLVDGMYSASAYASGPGVMKDQRIAYALALEYT